MVCGLEAALQNPEPAPRISGSLGQHFSEKALRHMVGAATGDQDPSIL